MKQSELEIRIYHAIKFIVKRDAIPDAVVVSATELAAREIVRHQRESTPTKTHVVEEDKRTEAH